MGWTRREMLKMVVAGGVAARTALSGGNSGLIWAPPLWAQPSAAPPDLAVIHGPDPGANVRAAVQALGGMTRFVSRGDKVVLKPNMAYGNPPEKATTTEPRVVRALAEMALAAGARRVLVLDYPGHMGDIVLEVSGFKKALKDLDDTFLFTLERESFFRQVAIPRGKELKTAQVAIDILEADCVINVPMAKSHGSASVSFGMKNWMGVVYDRRLWHVRYDLHQAIADFATFIHPKLTVLDATRGLLTEGPAGPGQVADLQTIVAGVDQVAVDAYGVSLAKWNGTGHVPAQIPYIVKAAALAVGTLDLEKLTIFKAPA